MILDTLPHLPTSYLLSINWSCLLQEGHVLPSLPKSFFSHLCHILPQMSQMSSVAILDSNQCQCLIIWIIITYLANPLFSLLISCYISIAVMKIHFFKVVQFFLQDKFLEVELLGQRIHRFFFRDFEIHCQIVSKKCIQFQFPSGVYESAQI